MLLGSIIVEAQYKALVRSLWLDGTLSSNPAGDIDVCLLCMLGVEQVEASKRGRSLGKGNHTECVCL